MVWGTQSQGEPRVRQLGEAYSAMTARKRCHFVKTARCKNVPPVCVEIRIFLAQVDAERLELARLLVKAGYTVSIGKDKEGGTRPRKYIEIGGAENEQSVG